MDVQSNGEQIYKLLKKLFPICRSITGDGVRRTLAIIKENCPLLEVHEVPTGTQVFDWTIPREWNIRDAYIADQSGKRIIDFNENNLHIVGYSTPIDKTVTLEELQEYLYSLPEQPDLIPYVTSYYKERFGFCISENKRKSLREGTYRIFIDSELKDGSLTYGDIIIPGQTREEILLSTYVCHPSMANDNLSGPCIAVQLAKWLMGKENRRYTYRIVFVPETIGSIAYLSRNLEYMKRNTVAGFILTCIGDKGRFSYLESRYGNTLTDKVVLNILNNLQLEYNVYPYLNRGSDERQYCGAGIDLPVCTIMRSKYGMFPEYHTSADNLDFVSAEALEESYEVFKECVNALENNYKYKVKCLGEPQLGKRGLYPDVSIKNSALHVRNLLNFIAYADGENDLIDISNRIKVPVKELIDIIKKLKDAELLYADTVL